MTQEPAHEQADHAPEPVDEEHEGDLDLGDHRRTRVAAARASAVAAA